MTKTSILLRMDPELKDRLEVRATEQKRSVTAHILHLVEQDLNRVGIPVVGKITADGKVEFDPDYFNTPQGIEQSR